VLVVDQTIDHADQLFVLVVQYSHANTEPFSPFDPFQSAPQSDRLSFGRPGPLFSVDRPADKLAGCNDIVETATSATSIPGVAKHQPRNRLEIERYFLSSAGVPGQGGH
jgi:hypothetical protein